MAAHPGVELLRALIPDSLEAGSVLDRRAAMAASAADSPPKSGTDVAPAELGGRPAEWVVPAALGPASDLAGPDVHGSPIVLYFHGGGYCMGNFDTHRAFAGRLATAAGARVVMSDYRLAPEHPFPAAVDDAEAAYRALLDGGADPNRIVVGGDSAGGGLTLALLLRLRDEGVPMPAGAVLLSPWADLTQTAPCYEELDGRDPLLTRDGLDEMAAAYLAGADARDLLASPALAGDLSGLPPLKIDVGDQEVLLDDSTRAAELARQGGVEVDLTMWPGLCHVFQIFPEEIFPESEPSIASMGEFIRERCRG